MQDSFAPKRLTREPETVIDCPHNIMNKRTRMSIPGIGHYYSMPHNRARYLACSEVALLEAFARAMVELGYCRLTGQHYLALALHIANWAHNRRMPLQRLSRHDIDKFAKHASKCHCEHGYGGRKRKFIIWSSRAFLGFLKTGTLHNHGWKDPEPEPTLVSEFRAWLVRHRGLSPSSVALYGKFATSIVSVLGTRTHSYTPLKVSRLVTSGWENSGPALVSFRAKVLRHFLRFLSATGRCTSELEFAVPRVRAQRTASPPFCLRAIDVDRVAASERKRGSLGLRDAAMILLTFRLGLRQNDVAKLRLEDIDWENATIRVAGKNRREELLPLPQDVGDAIVAYLRQARPHGMTSVVFLLHRAPYRPIGLNSVGVIVRIALARAGIHLPKSRTHLMRHAFATDVLRSRVPFATLQRLMRHRRVSTTSSYCHVDQALLATVSQPWPVS